MSKPVRIRTFVAGFLLAVSSAAQAIIPENGWWYVDGESGRGFNLEVQNTFLFLSSFGYDASGNPQWLVAGADMTTDRNWSGTWLAASRGWCYGCAPTTPTLTEAGTVTLAFTSSQTATLTTHGQAFSIRRFDMWRNDFAPDAMLGEWSAVIGTNGDVFNAERIEFDARMSDSSGVFLSGNRIGSLVDVADARCCTSGGKWSILLDSSVSYWRYFEFNRTGFNRVEGDFWLVPKGQSASGAGTFFQAFRTASYAFVRDGFGPASSKSVADEARFRAQQERQDRLLFERQPAGGASAGNGVAERFREALKAFGK